MFFGVSVTLGQTCDCCVRGGMVTASSNIDSGATGRLRRVYENGFRQSNLRFEIVALDGVGIIARSLDSQAWHSLCPPLAQRTTCIFTVSLAFLLAGIFLLTIAARHSQAYRTGTQNILKSSPKHCRSYPSLTRKNSMPHRQYPKLLQSGCTLHLGQQEAVLSKRGITIFCLKLRLKNLSLATVRISISAVAGHALKTRDSRQARCWCWSSAKLPCVCTRLAYTEKTLARKLEV